jgi:hypothetical protein
MGAWDRRELVKRCERENRWAWLCKGARVKRRLVKDCVALVGWFVGEGCAGRGWYGKLLRERLAGVTVCLRTCPSFVCTYACVYEGVHFVLSTLSTLIGRK